MPRPINMSNGELFIGLDRYGQLKDLYYPYVGLENHTARDDITHRIGVMINEEFSWIDDGNWDSEVEYIDETSNTKVILINLKHDVKLTIYNFVDTERTVFSRRFVIENDSHDHKKVKLFLHQRFRISDSNKGDTCFYHPYTASLIQYLDRRVFLVNATDSFNRTFKEYSIGVWGIENKQGVDVDAEDGILSMNNIEHGQTDSILAVEESLMCGQESVVRYNLIAAKSIEEAKSVLNEINRKSIEVREEVSHKYQLDLLSRLSGYSDNKYYKDIRRSITILKTHQDKRGATMASNDSDVLNYSRDNYSYCWPRDSAVTAEALMKYGYYSETKSLLEFFTKVLSPNGFLEHKYMPNYSVGSSWHPWINNGGTELPIQIDETAAILRLCIDYIITTNDLEFARQVTNTFIDPMTEFIINFFDEATGLPHPTYDLWEFVFISSSYSTAIVYSALSKYIEYVDLLDIHSNVNRDIVESRLKSIDENFNKYYYSTTRQAYIRGYIIKNNEPVYDTVLDFSSIWGIFKYMPHLVESLEFKKSFESHSEALLDKGNSNGMPRFEFDSYFNSDTTSNIGNPWVITTIWHGIIASNLNGNNRELVTRLNWVKDISLLGIIMPEQINPDSKEILSNAPLVWSHAEFLLAVQLLSN